LKSKIILVKVFKKIKPNHKMIIKIKQMQIILIISLLTAILQFKTLIAQNIIQINVYNAQIDIILGASIYVFLLILIASFIIIEVNAHNAI
jgi:hypothetical protein